MQDVNVKTDEVGAKNRQRQMQIPFGNDTQRTSNGKASANAGSLHPIEPRVLTGDPALRRLRSR